MNVNYRNLMLFCLLVFICSGMAFWAGVVAGRRSASVAADSGNLIQSLSELRKSERTQDSEARLDSMKFYSGLKELHDAGGPGSQKAAAAKTGSEKNGNPTASLKPGPQDGANLYAVQAAELGSRQAALKMLSNLTNKGYTAYVATPRNGAKLQMFRVLVGNFRTKAEAARVAENLVKDLGRGKYSVVEINENS
jgi:cell division septation protein DedD